MNQDQAKLKVAIVHDWFVGGGAEKVVLELHKIYPEAPIYTSYCNDEWRQKLDNKVVTGYLQKLGKFRKFLPSLRAIWFSHLDFSNYDLVISSSGAEAKGINTGASTVHINYCHAPTHYYWSRYDDYLKNPGFGFFDPIARLGLKVLVGPMRRWDYRAAQRPDHIITNSNYIKDEVKNYYGRDSTVINPPVDVARFSNVSAEKVRRSGFLIAGRQTPYKRFDLAVEACTKANVALTVVGNGPDHERLMKLAGPSISFKFTEKDGDMPMYFRSAGAFIFPGLDDFGITAVEAMAAGTPVIAYGAGGALDYVKPGVSGEFFQEHTVDSLVKVINTFTANRYDEKMITSEALRFRPEIFITNITGFINNIMVK